MRAPGLTPNDRAFADFARRANKPVVLVANKSEGKHGEVGAMESYALGLGDPIQISAEHGEGLSDLYDALRVLMPEPVEEAEEFDDDDIIVSDEELAQRPIRVAIVGRPNAGKSTLINHLLGEERLLTSAEAGTTRDSISVEITWQGREFRVFDTAGLRRRSRIEEKLEKLSVADALRAVRFAEVVVMMMDAQNRFEEQDLRIADLIEREGRAIVLAVNKWDLMERKAKSDFRAAHRCRSLAAAGQGRAGRRGVRADGRGHRPADDGDRGSLRGVEQARADGHAQSLVRAGGRCQPAARGLRPPAEAELHHPGQGAAAELCPVLLARRRRAAILSALSHQQHARGLRSAGHADPDHAARKGQSVRPQAQAAVVSEQASAQAADTPPVRSGAAAFIFVTILLDMLALGLILPILPKLVESFVDNDTATAARIFGLFGTAWALMQFLFSPILGALSDRFGRRPVVLLSNFGLALDYVLMALAPSLAWLFIGRVISGITSASISTAFAYIADVTPPERRAAVFGKIGAAFGAGFILGPALGGLLGGMDPRLPFWIAAGLSFANTLYGWLILPESLPPERRAPFRWKSASPLGALHLLRSNRILAGLSLANFFGQVAHVVLPSTFVLYATYRYGWDTTTVGLTLALVGVCAMVVQGAGVGPIVKRLGERRALLLGLACGALGFFIYGAAPTGPLFWIGIPVMSLWGVAGAAIQALTTQLVAPDQQGQLQGATNSVNSIAQMVGPFLFTLTFAYFISDQAPLKMPGAPFLLAAALLGLGLVIAWRTLSTALVRKGAGS